MADFVQSANVKSAIRKLALPIADVETFNSIVESVITSNPFSCVSYMIGGETHPAVEKTKETYTAKVVYQDAMAKTVGTGNHKFDTLAKFNSGVTALLAASAVTTAHGGTVSRDLDKEAYSATIKCHDANGELYTVNFSRDQITITSYEDDAIRTKVETWADTVAALA
jgi:23S rRNA U2552 (ribose-2'-O)-methylase RlmE/FtsJ